MKQIILKQEESTGQWQYQITKDGKVLVDWQYGPYDRVETIKQAKSRYGGDCFAAGMEEGAKAAKSFGSSRMEYLESAAFYYGKQSYRELSNEEKQACQAAFNAGVAAEKALE
jgi:hypothetical protein